MHRDAAKLPSSRALEFTQIEEIDLPFSIAIRVAEQRSIR
jgi:hypothetical protein